METPTVALSVRQPWAWLIVNGYKDIENRTWFTTRTGRVWIHASAAMTRQEYLDAWAFIAGRPSIDAELMDKVPSIQALRTMQGGIVGETTLGGCVQASQSPWFVGPYGFVVYDSKPLPFRPCKGALGFFKPVFI